MINEHVEKGATVNTDAHLWWSDFLAYAETGEPITGLEYMRLGNGPVPKRLMPVREDMQET